MPGSRSAVAWRPASWRRDNEPHKVPPHFKRKAETNKHDADCPIGQLAEREEISDSDRERRIRLMPVAREIRSSGDSFRIMIANPQYDPNRSDQQLAGEEMPTSPG
jgi:hypothetical protein